MQIQMSGIIEQPYDMPEVNIFEEPDEDGGFDENDGVVEVLRVKFLGCKTIKRNDNNLACIIFDFDDGKIGAYCGDTDEQIRQNFEICKELYERKMDGKKINVNMHEDGDISIDWHTISAG